MTSTTPPAAPPAASPESLLVRYRATGDAKALAALFDATAPSLFRIALSLVRDATAAEDALQETYLAALEHLDRYDASRPLVPWLVGILRVMALRARREAARVPDPVRVAAVAGAEREGEVPAERGEDSQRVRAAIEQLDEPYRSVALLRWRYGLEGAAPPGGAEDLSSTQLAALALLAAERCGIRVESRVWRDIVAFTLRQQEADGPARPRAVHVPGATEGTVARPTDRARGFAYLLSDTLHPDEGRPTGGMTACGIATLEIARYVLTAHGEALESKRADEVQRAVYDGLAWLDANWSSFANPKKQRTNVYHLAWLYAAERAFDLLGVQRLGARLWYPEMAAQVVGRQAEKGFWDSDSTHKPQAVLDTSFALLFLHRTGKELVPTVTDASDRPAADRRGR